MKKLSSAFLIFFLVGSISQAKDSAKKAKQNPPSAPTQEAMASAEPPAPIKAPVPTETVVFEDVKLSPTALLGATELKAVSHGIRRKKVFGIATVDIYVAEFYAQSPEKIQKTEDQVLNSFPAAGPVQIKLTLKRDLSGSDISKSFKEALKENDVDLSKPVVGLTELMTEVEAVKSFQKGEVFSLSADWTQNQITVRKPDGSTKSIAAESDSMKKLFAIWFGKPVDEKMNDLKKNLLK